MAIRMLCISTADAGRMLNVNRSTIWRYTQQNLLQGIPAGNRTLIPLYEVAHQMGITLTEAKHIVQQNIIEMYLIWMDRVV